MERSRGSRFGPYEIVAPLGAGGMGEVYRARDSRLQREVALKLLPPATAAEPEARQRFLREAQAASRLAHPHIVIVHDVGSVEETPYIVSELIEGEPLRQLLRRGPLPVRPLVDLAVQIADALAAAHQAGIVHRDLKPENIMVVPPGRVKILDFGLAKLLSPDDLAAGVGTLTQSGMLLGTANYMSPEQAAGGITDFRSDQFAFGLILYEMATGRQPFQRDTVVQTLSAIVAEEAPPLAQAQPGLPAPLRWVIERCLEKDPGRRYASTVDLFHDLRTLRDHLTEMLSGAMVAGVEPRRRRRWRAAAALAGATALVAAALLLWRARSPGTEEPPPAELVRLTSAAGLEDEPSFSPDGRSLAYTSDEGGHLSLWIRQVDGERAIRVGQAGVDEAQPAWSPDGGNLAFVSARDRGGRLGIFLGSRPVELYVYGQNGDLFVMPALGGTTRKLAENAYDPAWSPDGKRLAFRSIRDGTWRIYTVGIEDGRIAPVAGVEPRVIGLDWSPDGRWIAYVAGAGAASGWDLWVVPAAGGAPVRLTHDRATIALHPSWSRDGRWITFSSDRGGALNLWRVGFAADPPRAAGPPQRLTTGIGEDASPTTAAGGGIAYSTVHTAPDIWRLDIGSGRLTQLTAETTVEDYPRLSPDGRRLLFYSDRFGREELWMMELGSGELTRLSRGEGTQNAWSPDGRLVAYATPRGLKLLELPGERVRTLAPRLATAYPAFSPRGGEVCFQGRDARRTRLWRASLDGRRLAVVPTPEGEPGNPSWSPDGRTLYYQLDQFGYRNIWAVDLTTGRSRQLSRGNADDAHCDVSPDGRLLFLRGHRTLYLLPVAGGQPVLLHEFAERNRLVEFPAWTPDGKGIVFSLAAKTGDLFLLRPTASPAP